MWLDRFSGQSSPSGAHSPNRAYSPAPRRPSHLNPRAGLGLRDNRSTTSLDLSANVSSVSVGSTTTRNINGSALRYEQRPPPDVEDPTKVLRSILGASSRVKTGKENEPQEGETINGNVKISFGGLSLQDFANQDPSRPKTSSANVPVGDRRQKFEDFHQSISESDQVLKSVEVYLTNFKAELGQVSAEIENLQTRSVQLNARLDNRRQVEKLLGPAVEEVSISPITVRAIAEGPIDETFTKALTELEARSATIEKKDPAEHVKALEDIKPLLDDLKTKAIERIRDFIVSQIKALRSPNINAQVIQQQYFIRQKQLFSFLARNHPVISDEIAQAYINTMKWYYSSHFARYQQALQKMPIHTLDQSDLIGAEPIAKKNATKPAQHDAFGLGKRIDVLRSMTDSVLPSYLAEDTKLSQYLEVPFRHFNQALIDNVCAEYTVVTEIFSGSYQQVSRKLVEIFEPTFSFGHNFTKQLVESTTDCLGILMCVRLTQYLAFTLQRRKVPVADAYINYTNILLWPRFQLIMDQHCESLKKVPTSTNRGAAAAFSLVSAGNDASKASVAPHAITQRFGQFLHGILSLSAEAGDDEPFANSLGRLRSEYESLMSKLAKSAADKSKQAKFLANNYSLILTIIGDTQGKLAEEQKEHFGRMLSEAKHK